jgi:hypothetical protein
MPATQMLRRVAVNPIQVAKFAVVCFGVFDLKSKDVARDILPVLCLA